MFGLLCLKAVSFISQKSSGLHIHYHKIDFSPKYGVFWPRLIPTGILLGLTAPIYNAENERFHLGKGRSPVYLRTKSGRAGKAAEIEGQLPSRLSDRNRYQTVYAKEAGSAAAPTAGLHFTEELLDRLRAKGVGYGEVTLHVGLGTFRPVKVERIEDHLMHEEAFCITEEVAAEINRRRAAGGRIIAVGTTTCRVLESVTDEGGTVHPMSGTTGIFIYPGYRFKAIDALITNFHLPESTLLMLVSALAGKEFVMGAYEEAVKNKYRFFSFGDAMFIQ